MLSCSSAQLTLAGTLRGNRWRRQEVRAFRERQRKSAAHGSFPHLHPPALLLPAQSVDIPASSGPLLWGPPSVSCSTRVSWISTQSSLSLSQAGSPQLSPISVSSALQDLCPQQSTCPWYLPFTPSPVLSPALGLRTSWASSPASHDVAGAQPLGSGTSGCCLQVGRGLLRVLLTLLTPTFPGLSRGRVRWEERETERQRTGAQTFSFLGDFSLRVHVCVCAPAHVRTCVCRKLWLLMFLSQGTVAE